MHFSKQLRAAGSVLIAAALANVAAKAQGGAAPFDGAAAVASGKAGETLVCSLLYAPAIGQVLDRVRIGKTGEASDAHDRYANVEFSYLLADVDDPDRPIVVGTLWNGADKPPTGQVVYPFQPAVPGVDQTLVLDLDNLDLLAGPDFQLVCDVLGTSSGAPRRIPPLSKVADITLKRGAIPRDRVFFKYAHFHNAVADTQLDIQLIYRPNAPAVGADNQAPACPDVETDVAMVDAATLEPFVDGSFSATLEPGQTFGHTIGIPHEHQPPSGSPAVPVLVAMRYTAAKALAPYCQLIASVAASSRGVTRSMDVWEWRKVIER